jgi:deoxyribodipyrimidine photolyase-like uncharacterized protein
LQKIRDAVEKGFKEAADILGGSLPDISQQTLKAVRAEFDRWQSQAYRLAIRSVYRPRRKHRRTLKNSIHYIKKPLPSR